MLFYDFLPASVEAFSTNKWDAVDFDIVLPLHQAHSANVRRVPEEIDDITGVDALITNMLGLRIGVKTADCVPILLSDERNHAVAAVHSGWRGTVKNILSATIERMQSEFSTIPADVIAVIAPCIHLDAFEVGNEVYEAFASALGRENMHHFACQMPNATTGEMKWHINLPAVCRHQLLSLGLKAENVEVRSECTFEQSDKFFSARHLGKEFDRQRIINAISITEKPENRKARKPKSPTTENR